MKANQGMELEQLMTQVAGYDRRRCIDELSQIRRPRLDFTEEFLKGMELDRLRHVLLAAVIQSRKAG